MEVLFASLPHHCFWCFFRSRGPKLCPNRTGNTKFYKNVTRVHAYTRFPLSHVCPVTSRNKGNFSEKFPFSVFPDQLEQNSEVFGGFQQTTYTVYCCKTPKFESCYTIFCSKNAESWVILFKKMEFFKKKKQKKCKKNKKKLFFSFPTPHYHLTLRSVRKKNFKNFPKQFYTSFPKFEPIFKFCLEQRWQKRWQWRWRHRWKFCP